MNTQTRTRMIRVIAAVVDTKQLTLYQENGDTVAIPQGDPRLAPIVRSITPILAVGSGSVAEVDLGEEEALGTPYREFEEQHQATGIRFFRVAKATLANLLSKAANALKEPSAEPVKEQTLGAVPVPLEVSRKAIVGTISKQADQKLDPGHSIFVEKTSLSSTNTTPLITTKEAEKLLTAAEEIIANAVPASAPDFHDRETGEKGTSTIVAVVNDQVVGDVEKLKPQLTRAVQSNTPNGMAAFMKRIAAVVKERRHSIEDLLRFLEKGDLPIANDGSIVIYKVLRRKGDVYVDCHTQKVTQRVGSYVYMSPSLVDHNRHQECSNGLHVARRAYLGGFSGDVIVLAKVAPEDVIAVPAYDANKMRVCGYHILYELDDEAFRKLKQNQAFTDNDEAKILLGKALAGDHPPPDQRVEITAQQGEGVKITSLVQAKLEPPTIEAKVVVPAEALVEPKENKLDAPVVDPKEVVKEITKAKVEGESRAAKAKRLHKTFEKAKSAKAKKKAALELMGHKKKVKQSWTALGLSDEIGKVLQNIVSEKAL